MLKIQKLDLLISLYIGCIAISELMGGKTFYIGSVFGYSLNASVAIFVIPLIYTINDVLVEVYGAERTRSIIRSGLIVIFLFMLMSVLAISLPPSARFKSSEKAYETVFGLSARVAFASLTAFIIAEFTDVFIFVKIRKALGKKALWLRNNISNFISQFADTVIFMILAFWSFDKGIGNNVSFLTSLIIPYWLLKCAMSIIETPLVYVGVKWLSDEKKKT
jgi:uncharacterized integral membrane protein (TIGR00697 family)